MLYYYLGRVQAALYVAYYASSARYVLSWILYVHNMYMCTFVHVLL